MSQFTWGRCPTCKESGNMTGHRCNPLFTVMITDEGDDFEADGSEVFAVDAREAAEKFAEALDPEYYSSLQQDGIELRIRNERTGAETALRVTGEFRLHCTVRT